MEDGRTGVAWTGEGDLGTLPDRLRSLLHPAPRGSRAAKGALGRELREERGAVPAGRGAGRIGRLGRRGGRAQAPPGRMEDDRPGEEEPLGGHLAAFTRGLRSLLRAVRTAHRDI